MNLVHDYTHPCPTREKNFCSFHFIVLGVVGKLPHPNLPLRKEEGVFVHDKHPPAPFEGDFELLPVSGIKPCICLLYSIGCTGSNHPCPSLSKEGSLLILQYRYKFRSYCIRPLAGIERLTCTPATKQIVVPGAPFDAPNSLNARTVERSASLERLDFFAYFFHQGKK
ncbi:hypothetical protein L1278_002231 [Pontibacter sp. HSC-36F09]|nr:hypothetical protein [Pontibacter sp. HSC-36F09]